MYVCSSLCLKCWKVFIGKGSPIIRIIHFVSIVEITKVVFVLKQFFIIFTTHHGSL